MAEIDRTMETPRRGRRRWWPFASAALVVVTGSCLLVSYGAYREWPWSAYPSRLHVCGRDFFPSAGSQSREQIAARGDDIGKVGDVPGWFNTGELWGTSLGEPLTPGSECHVVMWVRVGKDAFKEYALSGGP